MSKQITTIADLSPAPRNANQGTPRGRGMIEQSVRKRGAGRSGLAAKDGTMIAGSQTLDVMAEVGMEIIPVHTTGNQWVVVIRDDLEPDSEEAELLGLDDNRAAEVGLTWDASVLAELSTEFDLSSLFNQDELDLILAPVEVEPGAGGDEFDPTPEEGETRTQLGQLWAIGGVHRLVVGDCTDPAVVARLMGGERADICFTSPPYNLGETVAISNRAQLLKDGGSAYVGGGDKMTEAEYLSFLGNITQVALDNAHYLLLNVQQLAGNKIALIEWLYAYREHFADVSVWTKSNPQPAMAERVMNSAFEYIFFLAAEQKPTRAIKTGSFRGTVDNVYAGSVANNEYSDVHGATFPLDFAMQFVQNFSQSSVLDMFLGTGTTFIAAHRTGRRCYGCEISPRYADVILRRAEAENLECVLLSDD